MVPVSDDDLLILSDDESDNGDTLVIDENNANSEDNTIIDNNVTPLNEELITFDDSDFSSKETDDSNASVLDVSNNLSFGTDSSNEVTILNDDKNVSLQENNFSLDSQLTQEGSPKSDLEEPKQDSGFSFGSSSGLKVGTMEEILAKTMQELGERADAIEKDIDIEKGEIDNLNTQIQTLEGKVKDSNDKVTKLTNEKSSILKNLKNIERMKNSSVGDEETPKVTSSKRK